jgi:arylsulfatase A-like enzyme
LLTGRYQDRFGYSRNPLFRPFDPQQGLSTDEQLLPEALKKAGYRTMGLGKWHLGAYEKYRPWNRGFDEYFGFLGGGHRYFPSEYNIEQEDSARTEAESYKTKLVHNGRPVEETEYLTDALSREAVSFIERNRKNPFFLYLAYNAPHAPLQASQQYLDRFAHISDPKRKTYAAMVSAVDDGVGAVLDKLDALGLTENTLVIFLSDNGGPEQDNASDNGVLRGGKGSFFEGGIRVPFAMQWPGHIPRNMEYNGVISSLDIFPTILANVKGSAAGKNPLDGVNLLPFLAGPSNTPPHEFLFWRHYDQKRYAVVSQEGLKLLLLNNEAPKLYQLNTDIGEKQDRAAQDSQQVKMLDMKRQAWEAQMVPPAIWGLNQEKEYRAGAKPY